MLRACLALLLLALPLSAHRLPVKVYTTSNGMPRNSARCMVPDANGMLWICTSEGLVRFDGYQFRIFGHEDGLPSRSILDMVPSRKGGYWVVTDAGVCRLEPGSRIGDPCRLLDVQGPTGDFQPDCLVEFQDGNVWVATITTVFHVSVDGRKLEPTPLRAGVNHGNFQTLAVSPDGTLFAATEVAVYQWKPGDQPQDITSRLNHFLGASEIMTTPAGDVWVVTPNRIYALANWKSPAGSTVRVIDYPQGRSFTQILWCRDGTIWAAGTGISRVTMDPAVGLVELEHFTRHEGLPGNGVLTLTEDRRGNLWGSTDGAGIFRIADAGFKIYSQDDGLASSRIAAVFESLRGDICVMTAVDASVDRANFAVQSGSGFSRVRYDLPASIVDVGWGWNQFGLQAHDGEWWLPTGGGLLRFAKSDRPQDLNRQRPIAIYDRKSPLGEDQVFRVFEDSHRDIWISAIHPTNTLVRWERKTGIFHHWTQSEGWLDDKVASVIREAPSGTLWVATFGELLRMRNQHFEVIRALPSAQVAYVRDLYCDRAGRIWVATARYGLYRCDNPDAAEPIFRKYTTKEGLSSNSVRAITEDDAGLIYAGTVRGIDRIDPKAPPGAYRIRHFTTADGVPDNEQNVAFHDHKGRLWFGSLDGLAELDPSKARPLTPPDVYITRLRVRGEDVRLPWEGTRNLHVDLASDRNQFEIQYAGVDLRSVASLRYQYRLIGTDRDWSQPVDDVSLNYASLPAGKFRFEVRALTADGLTGGTAAFDFLVQEALWRRWWFIALLSTTVAATVWAIFRYRVEHLLAIERLRARLASDLHDDIGSSLTQISILAELARRDNSRGVLEDVAGIARELVADMSDIVWAVKPHHDRFDALAHRMRRFADDTLGDIDLEFDAASLPGSFSIPLEFRHPLYLVFKEAAHNVARHSGATRVSIRMLLDDGALKLIVEDNGRGFDPDQPREGEGIDSTKRRMRDVGGACSWELVTGGGTRFSAVFPLKKAKKLHKLRAIFTKDDR